MSKMTVKDLADMINERCESYRYFWAYGLVKETIKIWEKEDNKNLLCEDAQIMVGQAKEILGL